MAQFRAMGKPFLTRNRVVKYLIRAAVIFPLIWYAYGLYNQDLGPQPADFLNKKLGNLGVLILVLNLWIGFLLSVWKPFPTFIRYLLRERRFLGVMCGIYLLTHFGMYLLKEGLEWNAVVAIFEKKYLFFGASALTIITILTLTSTDFAVKLFKYKNWKRVHRLVYLALTLVLFHVFLIEKTNKFKYFLILAPLASAQIFRFLRYLKQTFSAKIHTVRPL